MRTLLYSSTVVVATASGGVTAGGHALVSVSPAVTGGSLASGSAVPVAGFRGVGGPLAGGSASVAFRITPAGGLLAGGQANPAGSVAIASGGGPTAGGSAVVSVSPAAAGDLSASGSATIAFGAQGDGSLVAGGEGIVYQAGGIPDDLVDAVVLACQDALVETGLLTWFGTDDPMEPVLPYAVLEEPDEDDEALNTSDDMTADGHLMITCYAPTKKAARLLGDQVAAVLNDAPLVYSAGTHVFFRQSGRSSMQDPDPAPGGGDCWDEIRQFHFTYSYSLK